MNDTGLKYLTIAAAGALVAVMIARAAIDPFTWCSCITGLWLLVKTRAPISQWIELLVIAALLVLARIAMIGRPGSLPPLFLFCLGLAAILVLAKASVFDGGRRPESRWFLYLAIAIPLFSILANLTLGHLVSRIHGPIYDQVLFAADASFGVNLSTLVARLAISHKLLLKVLIACYDALPLGFALALAEYQCVDVRRLAKSAAIAACLGTLCYWLVPAVGPVHIFAGYPGSFSVGGTGVLPATAILDHAPPNAVPSLHLAWALLLLWNTRRGWIRPVAWTFAVMTALATLATGEHYFVDLIMAVPFAVTAQASAAAGHKPWRALLVSAAITGLWLVCVREEVRWPGFAIWTFSILSVATALLVKAVFVDSGEPRESRPAAKAVFKT